MPTLPEQPAWSGLQPDPDAWRPAPAAGAGLLAVLDRRGRLDHRPQGDGPGGFYRLHPDDGGPALFLKVVTPERARALLAADRVAAWLAQQDLRTPTLLQAPIALDSGHLLLVHALIAGRFATPCAADLSAVGATLARLHGLLAAVPMAAGVQTASAARDQALHAARQDSVALAALDHRAEAVRARIAARSPALPARRAQALHGDLNLGNLLISADGDAVPLDFEDSLHNWHAPGVDLAMALERLVLVPCPDDEQALRLGGVLLDAYRAHGGRLDWHAGELADTLQALAVRALLLLSGLHGAGRPVARDEWDKFITLYDQAAARAPLLRQLERH